ncbi:protein kinase domain-containing protein [Lignipirellula cremea]|uniref:Serine/threonine-protein kinase PknB n=1 Tax=Lignipirellula cremea TaxID=2528010 RepID=A0A518E1P0_9BACT|nr:protein kinase [Lignipirellula cremea]QDU98015.1 Serine/threonine-protein kinase PknB [Lignipirellula cremea]
MPTPRYELLEQIAAGDFATVYRARDNELGREVAVKQIHQQYLNDPAQLDRYWQEAQLLASLEHPYIMTIYDVVRDRGWLVLELMRGNLKQQLAGEPIDLESLRLTLVYTLSALHFLHQNGIVHGDVKPTNLLLDKTHRVKLGDFGIARRLADNEGSVVKGTTKYMAPEVCSPELGAVGPWSDIYSLGFSAYELMCGKHFDDLFPGLKMYGRDEQIAWMMWQATLDQRLPEIGRVLQGVPPDLAAVVEKMTEKDPARRYRNAEKPMLELRARGGEAAPTAEEQQAEVDAEKQAKKRRLLVIGAFVMSLLLSLGVLFLPLGSKPVEPPPVANAGPRSGVLTDIAPDQNRLWIRIDGAKDLLAIDFDPGSDQVFLNDSKASFSDLQLDDQVEVKKFTSEDGSAIQNIVARRAVAQQDQGVISAIDVRDGTLQLTDSENPAQPLSIYVPVTARVTLNGEAEVHGEPYRLRALQPGDRATVSHGPGESRREAKGVDALRTMSFKGAVVKINTDRRELTATLGREESSPERTWPLAQRCEITLNGSTVLDGRELTLNHLEAGDAVTVQHDAQITAIAARREFTVRGTVASLDRTGRSLEIRLDNYPAPIRFTLAEDCEIDFLASGEPVSFDFLREGDTVQATHLSPDLKSPVARTLSISPTPDRRTWAVVLGVQDYSDIRQARLDYAAADAEAVHRALLQQYRTAQEQCFFELNPSRLALERTLPNFLKSVPPGSQLIVYFVGHGYLSDQGDAVLAMKDFDAEKRAETGVPLSWLVTQIENTPAAEKVLLLDASHHGASRFANAQPSSAELVETLKPNALAAASTSVVIVASSRDKEKGIELRAGGRGAFGTVLEEAFNGAADEDQDYRVSTEELIRLLDLKTPEFRDAQDHSQTPLAFLPNATPERVSEEYKEAVRTVLGSLAQRTLDEPVVKAYETAHKKTPDQPDLSIAYGLANLKHNRTAAAQKLFEQVRTSHPDRAAPYLALAWQNFMQKDYKNGIADLKSGLSHLDPAATGAEAVFARYAWQLAGEMREFALQGAEPPMLTKDVAPLDQFVIEHGPEATALYRTGLEGVRSEFTTIDKQIADLQKSPLEADRTRVAGLKRDRKRLTYFSTLDLDAFSKYLIAELNVPRE